MVCGAADAPRVDVDKRGLLQCGDCFPVNVCRGGMDTCCSVCAVKAGGGQITAPVLRVACADTALRVYNCGMPTLSDVCSIFEDYAVMVYWIDCYEVRVL
mmetsp:Transcript_15716/g.26210  ORF Transcript_15716/g.26210 Transcript_15716/m.26210 type:complete len:100 (+) Transcript_15716:2241-2540(+)